MTEMRFHRGNSYNIAPVTMRQGWGGRPTERWQDKSREVRRGRLAGKGMMIKSLARCATAHDSLSSDVRH